MNKKEELFAALHQLQKRVLAVQSDDVDELDRLREELTALSAILLQEGNPYALNAQELEQLQAAFSQITNHAEQLATIISEHAKILQKKGKAAASYLKHS